MPLGVGTLSKPVYLVNIDDAQPDPAKRIVAAQIVAGTSEIPFGRQPVRYLQFFLSAPTLPENFAETGSGTAVSRACASGCESTSGWITLK
jgi:hypothetical protein